MVKYEMLGLAAKYGLSDVGEGLSVIRDDNDDNETSNDSVISLVSSSTFIRLSNSPSRTESDFRISVRS